MTEERPQTGVTAAGLKSTAAAQGRRRRLRAIFAADVAGFSSLISMNETRSFNELSVVRAIADEELAAHGGWLFGLPGDGIFAVFESAIDAVECALAIQERSKTERGLGAMRLRIGVHVGEVLFQNEIPFGEALAIAARLESIADPGGVLVSSPVVSMVSSRVEAVFENRGAPALKNMPRRFSVYSVTRSGAEEPGAEPSDTLDKTLIMSHGVSQVVPMDVVDGLAGELAELIGPIASVVVAAYADEADSFDGLVAAIATEVSDPAQREAFCARARAFAPKGDAQAEATNAPPDEVTPGARVPQSSEAAVKPVSESMPETAKETVPETGGS